MRHLFTAFAVIALLVAIVIDAPFVSATGDPDADQNAKVVRNASKSTGRIAKGAVKRVRSASADATKKLKTLTKALRNGKKAEKLTGLPPLPDGSVSPQQLQAIFDRFIDCVVEFHGAALGSVEDAYDDVVADSSWDDLNQVTTSSFAAVGFGGPADDVVNTLSDGYESANDKFVRAIRKFQSAMRGAGFTFSFVGHAPALLSGPGTGPNALPPTDEPQVVATIGDCEGIANAFVYRPTNSLAGDSGLRAELRTSVAGSVTTAAFQVVLEEPDGPVLRYSTRTPVANAFGRRTTIVLTDDRGMPLSGAFPILLVPPAPAPPPDELQLQIDVVTATSTPAFGYGLGVGGKNDQTNLELVARAVEEVVDQTAAKVAEFFDSAFKIGRLDSARFPCGAGPHGFTICPNLPAASPGGRSIVIAILYGTDIPLSDPVNHYQYGFVFDQDGNSGNNYIPIPQFEGDFYRDTDKWYSAEYTPSTGWELKVTDARNGGFVPVSSAARVIIEGRTMLLVVPASEFSVANPAYRTTAFRHTGDFGQNPPHDWSADYDPPPLEALRPLRTQ